MSLANLFVQGNRVVLQADAGGYYPDGTIAHLGPKIHVLMGLPCAFTIRGIFNPEAFAATMNGEVFPDVESFLDKVPELVRRFTQMMMLVGEADPLFCWYIACHCQGRPWGLLIANDDRWFAGQDVAGGKLISVLNTIGGFVSPSEMLGRDVDFSDPASFDIERDSITLIAAQRSIPWAEYPVGSSPDAVPAIRIGGWVDQAEVTAAGVTMRRLIEWPDDRPGERITA